jgi:hypothetical protein
MPLKVFERYGVSQPAWFRLEVFDHEESENPNEKESQEKKTIFTKVPMHACVAFIDEKEENLEDDRYIKLPPRLFDALKQHQFVWV